MDGRGVTARVKSLTRRSALLAFVLLILPASFIGQQRGRGAQPPESPRAAAPIDLSGYWVSIITEDWIWRMTTPKKGDIGAGPNGGFAPIPLNPEGRRIAMAWDPAKDVAEGNQC